MKMFLCLMVAFAGLAVQAQTTEAPPAAPVSLAQLAQKAELIALAQARDTDYFTRRGIPVSGSAYLRILIPYKVPEPLDIVEVYEKGLHENECYFANPSVFEEGRRYLIFLRKDPENEERYRGLPEGCAIEVLVRSNNRYAVRFPVTGIDLSDPLEQYAEPMVFSDPYALIDDESLPASERDALLATGLIAPFVEEPDENRLEIAQRIPGAVLPEPPGTRWIITQGIELSTVRELMGPAGVSAERRPDSSD